jgi:RimJ/RimL family protein N-acetyltransferase
LIGEIGCKGGPDANGVVEIGYGIVPSARNHGFATEMVQGLVGWLSTHPTVKKVIAECLETNAPSAKVLEKSGFQKINTAGGRIHWENFK